MPSRSIVVLVTAPDGRAIRLRGRVAEAVLALAVHLGGREEALNHAHAWNVRVDCGARDVKITFGDSVKPVEFRSGLGA